MAYELDADLSSSSYYARKLGMWVLEADCRARKNDRRKLGRRFWLDD